jgi:hypothetical protein
LKLTRHLVLTAFFVPGRPQRNEKRSLESASVSRLSIIIPTLGDWQSLEATLVSVLQNRPPRSEVVVVFNRPYDDPYELCDEVRFVAAPPHARMVELLNAGFAAARAEVLHVLLCGATVVDGWTEPALRHFNDAQTAAVAPLVLDAACPTQVATAGSVWSPGGRRGCFASGLSADTVLTTGRHWFGPDIVGGFYRRTSVADVAALDATLPIDLALIDLGMRLVASGRRLVLEVGSRVAIDRGLLFSTPLLNHGWHSERLFWRYAAHGSWLQNVAAHLGCVSSELLRGVARPVRLARTVGRLLGACDMRGAQRTEMAREAPPLQPDQERRVDLAHATRSPERGAGQRRSPVSLSATEETT